MPGSLVNKMNLVNKNSLSSMVLLEQILLNCIYFLRDDGGVSWVSSVFVQIGKMHLLQVSQAFISF